MKTLVKWCTSWKKLVVIGTMAVLVFGNFLIAHAALGGTPIAPAGVVDGKSRNVFEFVIKEGETLTDQVEISNNTSETVKVYLFPSGFELQNDQIVEVPSLDEGYTEPGTWIKLEKSEVIIQPNTHAIVGFSITAPEVIDVGDHLATLFAQSVPVQSQGTRGSGITINVRNGVRVYITVPGTIHRELTVQKASHQITPIWKLFTKKLINSLALVNDGNVTLRPFGSITMRGFFGQVGVQDDLEFAIVRRGQTVSAHKEWIKRAPYFGRFVVDYEIHLGEREQVNEDGTKTMLPDEITSVRYVFWVFPWIEFLALLLVIFFLHLLRSAWLYWIIVRRLRIKTKVYTVVKGDTLMKVAAKLGMDPKVLAKFNLVRWPYELKTGDKLLVPIGHFATNEWFSKHRLLLADKDFWKTIFGHFFRGRMPHHIADRAAGRSGSSTKSGMEFTTLVADKGDTIGDVADFAGVSVKELAKYNNLKPPYRLRVGQELKIPKQKYSKPKQ